MKKLLFVVALMAMVATASNAQFKYGGGLTLGTEMSVDGDMGLGLNLRGDYSIDDNWSIAPGFTFIFPSSNSVIKYNAWQLNADAHYKFHETDGASFYGLAGLNYSHVSWDFKNGFNDAFTGLDNSDGELGLNIGAGANFGSMFYGELKYDTAFEQLGISIGVLFGGN